MLKVLDSKKNTINLNEIINDQGKYNPVFDGPMSWLPPSHPALAPFDPYKFAHHRVNIDRPTLVIRGLTPPGGQEMTVSAGILTPSDKNIVDFVESCTPEESAKNECALIDTCSIVFKVSDYFNVSKDLFGDEELLCSLSNDYSNMVGIKIGSVMPPKNYYQNTRRLEYCRTDDGHRLNKVLGFVAWGGNADSFQIYLNAEACEYIQLQGSGWDKIKCWGENINAKLKRVDLAYDDLGGERFNVHDVEENVNSGMYNNPNGGRKPKSAQVGCWKNDDPDGDGLTCYVGSRSSSRYYRIYEKGKQLGDSLSKWVRVELELKANNFYIPWDVLIEPGKYLAGSCKALKCISNDVLRLVNIQKKKVTITISCAISNIKRQYGKHLNMLYEIGMTAEEILFSVKRDGVPKNLELSQKEKMSYEKCSRHEFESFDYLSDLSFV